MVIQVKLGGVGLTNIIVVFPKIEEAKSIRNLLVRSGFSVVGVCTTGAQAINYADSLNDGIVICGYRCQDMIYLELQECLPAHFEMLLIASQNLWSECAHNNIVCLALPIKAHDLVNTVEMMVQTIIRSRRKRKLKPKDRNSEERALIDEAKLLLIERNNMSEEEAHRYIQKCSMDSGTNMVETAQMVLSIMQM